MTTKDVAAYLNVSENTVRYWRHVRVGPTWIKVGRLARYKPTDVDTWLAAHTTVHEISAPSR